MTTKTPYALIVGWDGVRFDYLKNVTTPVLDQVVASGAIWQTQMPLSSEAASSTAPGWSTLLSGVWPRKHGITDNVAMPNHFADYPLILERLHQARPESRSMAATCAAMLGSTKGPGPVLAGVSTLIFHDVRAGVGGPAAKDPYVHADAVHQLANRNHELSFVYYASTDQAGHRYGADSDEYRTAIERLDSWTGELIDAVRSRETFETEDWLIMITTDHGHRDEGGHGGDTWQERQSFIAFSATSMARDHDQCTAEIGAAEPVDLAPTILTHLGIELNPDWGLDGVSLLS